MNTADRLALYLELRAWWKSSQCEALTMGRTTGKEGLRCPGRPRVVREGRIVCTSHGKAETVEWWSEDLE